MELAFDDRGLLVAGVHEVTLDTVKEYFGKFQRSDRRITLFAKLVEYLDAVRKAGCGQCVIIDGSFVMKCVDEPDDIDLVLVLPTDWDDAVELKPYQYNLVSKRVTRKTHGFDLIVVKSGSVRQTEWEKYFQGMGIKWRQKFGWPDDIQKGIVKVML